MGGKRNIDVKILTTVGHAGLSNAASQHSNTPLPTADDIAFARGIDALRQLAKLGLKATLYAPCKGGCRIAVETVHTVQ
jgi:hypothetical protein